MNPRSLQLVRITAQPTGDEDDLLYRMAAIGHPNPEPHVFCTGDLALTRDGIFLGATGMVHVDIHPDNFEVVLADDAGELVDATKHLLWDFLRSHLVGVAASVGADPESIPVFTPTDFESKVYIHDDQHDLPEPPS